MMRFDWWFCLLLILSLISYSSGILLPDFGALKTEQLLYYVEENVTLHCYSKSPFHDKASFTYKNDEVIPEKYVTQVNSTYARLDKPSFENETYYDYTYICLDGPGKIIGLASVYSEYRPRQVTGLTYFQYDRLSPNFFWDLGEKGYKKAFSSRPLTNITPEWTVDNTRNDSWQACDQYNNTWCFIRAVYAFYVSLRVNITNVYRGDCVMTYFLDNYLLDHVKPSPVTNFAASEYNTTCVKLTWEHNLSNLTIKIKYLFFTCPWRVFETPPDARESLVCQLHAGYKYSFEIRAIPSTGYPSDPVRIDLTWKGDGSI